MSQKEIEIILTRQLASCLAMPVLLVDPEGALIYYNEPAEVILGLRFDETGEMPLDEWSGIFQPTDVGGAPLSPDRRPLVQAIFKRRPAHESFWIRGPNHLPRHISAMAFPIIGQCDRFLGAMAVFWELSE